MGRTVFKPKRSFFWQGLLIVLPVGVLAAFAFFALRQDKAIALQEARDRAQEIAEGLLPRIATALTPDLTNPRLSKCFLVNSSGDLVFPPPTTDVPDPAPFELANLTAEQARLWQKTQASNGDNQQIIDALSDFIATDPPPQLAGAAAYRVGMLLSELGDPRRAAEAFQWLRHRYHSAVGESGLPLRPLAQLKLVELSATTGLPVDYVVSPDDFCFDLVFAPTPLTPFLLARVKALFPERQLERWQQGWNQHELLRDLFAAARHQMDLGSSPSKSKPIPSHFWVESTRPFITWITNVISSTNEVPVLSAVEVQQRTWLVTHTDKVERWADSQETSEATRLRKGKIALRPSRNRNIFSLEWDVAAKEPVDDVTGLAPDYTSHWFVCRTDVELSTTIAAIINATGQVPEYFGIGVEIADRPLVAPGMPDLRLWERRHLGGKPSALKKQHLAERATNILASATGSMTGQEQLKVSVLLTSAPALFERQTARSFWFSSLVVASSLAALIGLFAVRQAFRREAKLNELKSSFVSSVSHELRAPIASVRLMAENLQAGKIQAPERQAEYFHFIGQECRRLSSLIENVLDFSRIEQGRKQYDFEPTDLLALVHRTVQLMDTYAAERAIKLVCRIPDHQTSAEFHPQVDSKAIQQALINLIDNALKHSPKGETVQVGLEYVPASDRANERISAIHLWVEDRGEGIALAEQEKIFERFYRCGSELRRETQGVGIGLSIVKHIIEAHEGSVTVQSEPGQGTRFTLSLPVLAKDQG